MNLATSSGGFTSAPGELMEALRRLPELSRRLLETFEGVLGALGAVLEASWEVLGRSCKRPKSVGKAPWVVLEPS